MRAENTDSGPIGVTTIFGFSFQTTGILGYSAETSRGFPSWSTIPSYRSLASGRNWHLFFAWVFVLNGLVYVVASILNRHVWRDLVPSLGQIRGIGRTISEHVRFRFDHGRDYNVLQKLSYLAIIFVVLPLVILAGLGMSPAMDAAFPWIVDFFSGRQTARTIHFIAGSLIVLFVVVHVLMVLISGVWNNLRSMITGRYSVKSGEKSDE